jgi:hypothetical protein
MTSQKTGTSVVEIIKGGIYLAEHSHYPNRPDKPRFGENCSIYELWRKDGKTHQQAIAKMDELQEF